MHFNYFFQKKFLIEVFDVSNGIVIKMGLNYFFHYSHQYYFAMQNKEVNKNEQG